MHPAFQSSSKYTDNTNCTPRVYSPDDVNIQQSNKYKQQPVDCTTIKNSDTITAINGNTIHNGTDNGDLMSDGGQSCGGSDSEEIDLTSGGGCIDFSNNNKC